MHRSRLQAAQEGLSLKLRVTADDTLGQKVVLIIEGEEKKLELDWNQIDPLKRPKAIYFVPNFLETSSGKIQRNKTVDLLNLNQP